MAQQLSKWELTHQRAFRMGDTVYTVGNTGEIQASGCEGQRDNLDLIQPKILHDPYSLPIMQILGKLYKMSLNLFGKDSVIRRSALRFDATEVQVFRNVECKGSLLSL